MKKSLTLAVLFLVTAVVLNAETYLLVYKWRLVGKQELYDNEDADTGILQKVRMMGFAILTYDDQEDNFQSAKLIRFWKEKGTRTFKYCPQKFMYGEFTSEKKTDQKGPLFELTTIGENYHGWVKRGIKLMDKSQLMVPRVFIGIAAWKNLYDSGKLAVGSGKIRMNFDKKRTFLLSSKISSDDSSDNKDILSKLSEDDYKILFANKPVEAEDLEGYRSVYKITSSSTGLFEWLGIGKTDNNGNQVVEYAFPTEDGNANEVLTTDGNGKLYWTSVNSRDEYLLNRANHIGTQKADTISDFKEAVEKILEGELPDEVINNITNQIDMAEFLKELDDYIKNSADNVFNEYVTKNLDPTTIVQNMDSTDIDELIKKLRGDSDFTGLYDPTSIINNMDSTDISTLKSKLSLDQVNNIKDNLNAKTAPTATDDEGEGYSVGSLWLDTTNQKAYFCLDATDDAAVWLDLTAASSINADDVIGFDEKVAENAKLQHITVNEDVTLDALAHITVDDGDDVHLSNMKDAIGAIIDYISDNFGDTVYDKSKL